MSHIALLGCGSWGTTLAQILANKGELVRAWHYKQEFIDHLNSTRVNPLLPDQMLNSNIIFDSEISSIVENAEFVILSVPSHSMRETINRIPDAFHSTLKLINTSKGIEMKSLFTMSEVIVDSSKFTQEQIISLYGPSHSEEVIQNLPTAMVSASINIENAISVQKLFSTQNIRVYTTSDIKGVEIGGSLKNVIAIASGICSGSGYGDNANAALITRGLSEITRLGVAMGSKEETFYGLSGIGDLIATCLSAHSRNRFVGNSIALGKKLNDIVESMGMVAEGVNTTKSIIELSEKFSIEMPISEAIYKILFEEKNPKKILDDLMIRSLKNEHIKV